MRFGRLGLGLTQGGGLVPLTNLFMRGYGDSTMEYMWSQYTAAGEAAFIAEAENYIAETVTFEDGAKSGSYLSSLAAIAAGATVTNRWVDDTTGTLADGAQITANVVGLTNEINYAAISIGINDHSFLIGAGVTEQDFADNLVYVAARNKAVKNSPLIVNTMGRDTGGNDAGANVARKGTSLAIASGGDIKRGVDVYDLPLTDAKHYTQVGQETFAERLAFRTTYLSGNQSTISGLGPAVTSAVLKTDVIDLTLAHQQGTDITAPSSGAGGIDATDDGTAMVPSSAVRIDATTARLNFSQGKAPLVGSVVEVWVPFGANGNGLSQSAPDVFKDNSSLTLPIQSDIITATNGDPIQALDNLVMYWDARGSVKTLTASTELDAIARIAGSVASHTQVADGDHATWDSAGMNGVGALKLRAETDLNYSGAFTAGGTHALLMALKMPATMAGANSNMLAFANSGGSTDTQARLTFASDNVLYWTNNEASAAQAVSPAFTGGETVFMLLQFVDTSLCNCYMYIVGNGTYNNWTTPAFTFDPRNNTDYESQTYITIGGRSGASEDGTLNLEFGAYAHTTDVLTQLERETILPYWVDRF